MIELVIFLGIPALLIAIIYILICKLKAIKKVSNTPKFKKIAIYIMLCIAIISVICMLPFIALIILMSLPGASM